MTSPDPESTPRHGVLLQVAYDGTAFHGWAAQAEGRTVQDTLRGAIRAIDPRATDPRGTSRTDAGVHAEAQMVAFDTSLAIAPRGWVLALNGALPDDVAVRSARAIPPAFNPRFANRGKRYRYRVLLDRVRDPLQRTRAWRVGWPLDLDKIERELTHVVGTHDFAAFRSTRDARSDTTRTIGRASLERGTSGESAHASDHRIVSIVFEGDGFLYNMVRILVGTLVDVARGHSPEGTIARALATKERGAAGMTAPAHGLTLEHVDVAFPPEASEPWPR